jgi:hypothetical protein
MANARKRILELTPLPSASLDTTIVGVDGGTTYRIELDVLADAVTSRVNILDRDRLASLESVTSSFESKGRSVISSSAQITALGFVSTSADLTSLNSFTSSQNTLNTAFTNGISARLQTSSFNDFSASVHSEILAATNEQDLSAYVTTLVVNTLSGSVDGRLDSLEGSSGSYLTSLNGTISGSSQLTSSYDERYVLSGSITQTTWDNIANKPSGIVSQSTDLSSLNSFTQSVDSRVDSLESWSSSLTDTFATDLEVSIVSSSVAATIGIISQNTGLVSTSSFNSYTASITTASLVTSITNLNTFTASQSTSSLVNRLNAIENISGSWITESETGSFLTSLNGAISSSAQITTFGFVSGSYETTGRGIISSSANLVTTSSFNSYTASISTASLVTSISNLNSATSSYLTSLSGAISSSSQLTSSYDSRYTLSGSVSAVPSGTISGSSQITAFGFVSSSSVPAGTISGSSQLTASYDTRYALSGSGGTIPGGTISGSTQITTLGFATTSSLNTLTASFNSFTASAQSVTTGSNSFNGTQTITGSLIITTGSFVASQILANTASLYLTSGSNMYVQNNGLVEITGSLNVTATSTLKGMVNVGTGSGDEGGEIQLALAQTNNNLTGSINIDVWQNRLRIWEGGGTNRGGYFDISTLGAGVGTDLGKLTYFIEAYANVSYTLPGSYTSDVCRYSVVSTNVNVPTAWFNTSTYTFTPLKAGYWEIIASYDVYRNGEATLIIQKNGTSVAGAGAISSVVQQVTKIIYLNGSTDYINVYNSGVNANARTQTSSNAFFQARFVGA